MATERLRTVHSSGVGGGYHYSSLSGWEAGENANLVSLDEIRIAECYEFSDTTAVNISGWTTDATRYIKITSPSGQRHSGAWTTSGYRLEVADANAITIAEEFGIIEYLQISVSESSTSARFGITTGSIAAGVNAEWKIEKCIVIQASGSSGTGSLTGIRCNDADLTMKISNCLLASFTQGAARGVQRSASTAMYIYNCGAYGCDTGFDAGAATATAINCWAQSCTDGFTGTWEAASDYNLSELSSDAPGSNSKNSTVIVFVSEGTDFHLDSSDTGAKDSGTDLSGNSSYPISDDIDGQTRSGTWDIGPDEIVGGSGAISGTSSGSATTSAALTGLGALLGTSDGLATVIALLSGLGALSGSSDGVATVSGNLLNEFISGLAEGLATASGTLTGVGSLSGSLDGLATTSALLSALAGLSGQVSAAATVDGVLIGVGSLAGLVEGLSTTSGLVNGIGSLSGLIEGVATVSGALSIEGEVPQSIHTILFSSRPFGVVYFIPKPIGKLTALSY